MDTHYDKSVDQFEHELKSGNSPQIEDHLTKIPEEFKQSFLFELISLEVFYRVKQSQSVRISDYARFGQAAAFHAERMLDSTDSDVAVLDPEDESATRPARMIGRYKLLQKLGEGGMGTVWMAEQEEPVKRRVALKVVRPELASKEVIARFDAEKQALAIMDHQNIARVLDAGTTENGKPYFVMELVKGIPITQYCDDNKLDIDERLKLFVPVCKAVQHAHQKGILHRDLKPSNVLVTLRDGESIPKVIDFGLAKATSQNIKLTDMSMLTEFGKVVGTLQYMSPEQAELNGLDVDSRTDIYSLGVMLYELLTGSTPLDKNTLGSPFLQVLEIIREKDPPTPSTRLGSSSDVATSAIGAERKISPGKLHKLLQGELDWVVMKALEKDRTRRYQTASELAREISNYLNGAAVSARPPSIWYRVQKHAIRNRGLIASIFAVGLASLIGIAGASYGLIQANQLRDEQSRSIGDSDPIERAPSASERWGIGKITGSDITCEGHEDLVFRVAFSSDGSRFASASADWTIKLWNARSGQEIRTFSGHTDKVGSVAFSPDDRRLASASYDHSVILWETGSGKQIKCLEGHSATVADVAFCPNGKFLASASDDQLIKLWDAKTGEEIFTLSGHSAQVGRVAFSPKGDRLASASVDETIKLWDVETGQEIISISGEGIVFGSIAFSPDGSQIASTSKNSMSLWNVASGKRIKKFLGHQGWIHNVAFSPDGTCLASASGDATIKLWDVNEGREISTLTGHSREVISVAFSPDGERIASASFDATIKLWDMPSDRKRN